MGPQDHFLKRIHCQAKNTSKHPQCHRNAVSPARRRPAISMSTRATPPGNPNSSHDVLETHYPQDCPFCRISQAYPPSPTSPIPLSPDPNLVSPQCHLILSTSEVLAFLDIMPMAPGHILVTTRDHYAKLTDMHSSSAALQTARELGSWLPRVSAALCRVTGITDWNVVQNNGIRAAQVVPHVHFHLIPRYSEENPAPSSSLSSSSTRSSGGGGGVGQVAQHRTIEPRGLARSWKMFGRGTREDLDDDEGARIASELRDALRELLKQEKSHAKL